MSDRGAVVAGLRERGTALAALSDDGILDGICAALDAWRGPGGPAGEVAAGLASKRGQSEAMLRYGLDRLLEAHRRDAMKTWLAEARAEAKRLIAQRTPGESVEPAELRGPGVIAQVLAGNVAGLAIPATLEALLARSAVLLKPAEGDPLSAFRFKESLDRFAPVLGAAVHVERWGGGDEEVEAGFLGAVDFVVASGGADMVASLSRRIHGPRAFYGPRFSVGLVGMEWIETHEGWWDEVAREIALWDQEGCLSPRILYVAADPERFARRLASALRAWEERWPAPPRSAGEAAAIHGFRAPYEMAGPGHAGCIAPEGAAWGVVWDQAPSLVAGPPGRLVRVTRRPSPPEFEELLVSGGDVLQGIGIDHLAPDDLEWRRGVERSGVPWTTSLTQIQNPPAGWRADGRSGLAELLAAGHRIG